jgi:hypothetical protein
MILFTISDNWHLAVKEYLSRKLKRQNKLINRLIVPISCNGIDAHNI